MGAIIGPEKAEIGWGVHVHCLEKKAKTWRCFPSWNINVLSVKAAMGQLHRKVSVGGEIRLKVANGHHCTDLLCTFIIIIIICTTALVSVYF